MLASIIISAFFVSFTFFSPPYRGMTNKCTVFFQVAFPCPDSRGSSWILHRSYILMVLF